MIRVSIGPTVNSVAVLASGLFLINAALAAGRDDRSLAALSIAAAVSWLVEITSSLRQRICVYACASGFAALSVAAAIEAGDRLMIVVSVVACVFMAVMYRRVRRRASGGAVRTEELVGWTVSDAERVLGYAKGLQPAGMEAPTLVPIPASAAPPGLVDPAVRAELVVMAVALDPSVPSITFGVAPPHTIRRRDVTREEMQAELVARVGGYPGDLRPERRVLGAPTPR